MKPLGEAKYEMYILNLFLGRGCSPPRTLVSLTKGSRMWSQVNRPSLFFRPKIDKARIIKLGGLIPVSHLISHLKHFALTDLILEGLCIIQASLCKASDPYRIHA